MPTRLLRCALGLMLALALCRAQAASPRVVVHDHWFVTSDHVRLHMLEAGNPTARTILFIPGLAMPAWIWEGQLQAFASRYHVVALDPRGQGRSEVAASGYEPRRRGQDIAEAIAQFDPAPVVIVGWSLGVLDTLAYVRTHGDSHVAGLVLVDNSVGEEPPPTPLPHPRHPGPPLPYPRAMQAFVHGLFRTRRDPVWLERLTNASLVLPEPAEHALRAYPMPRSYWKEAVYATAAPLLYVVRPRWAAQAGNLARNRPGTETEIFTTAGHALFVDEPARFNALLSNFLRRRVWP